MGKTILLTGRPGVGKTTVIERLLRSLADIEAGGFFTREVREASRRIGFDIVTLDGQKAPLARAGLRSPHRVSKYGVDVASLDRVGVAAIRRAVEAADLVVIDEIGKMELFSDRFREAVTEAVESPKPVVATVMAGRHPFVDALKRQPNVTLIEVTEASRDEAPDRVRRILSEA